MALGKSQQRGNLPQLDIIHQRHYSARLLEPVALPQLAGADALEDAGLVVEAPGHRPAVDGVDDAVGREKPHLVPPFGGGIIRVDGVVVVD